MKRLFGTDGIRAVAGKAPLDPATVRTFGAALGRVVSSDAPRKKRRGSMTGLAEINASV